MFNSKETTPCGKANPDVNKAAPILEFEAKGFTSLLRRPA